MLGLEEGLAGVRIPDPVRAVARAGGRALSALLDAFVARLAPLAARVSAGPRHVAVVEPGGLALHTFHGGRHKGRAAAPLHLRDGERAPDAFRSGDLELRLPPEQFLTRALRLPDAGRGYLQPIIAHRLERLTPWRADKVLYGFSVVEGVAEDGTIGVELLATSLDLAAPFLKRLADSGLTPTALGSAAEPLDAPLRFDLYRGRAEQTDGRLRARTARALAIVLAALGPACLISFALASSAATDLREAEESLASLRAKLSARSGPGTSRERALIEAKRPESAALVLIDRLSRALPDNTVLRELDIDPARIRLVGRSADAPALIARLEAEAQLRNLRFAAPVIRDADRRDAFDLVAARGPAAEAVR
ncbi:PilN domain-containing protein [uncultured Methylobacterium sp.]|uniref:PilN domain-containing protein n=1 Tax=uncultured Methylobacterium sp. TaxID=157278 RepID=UPI0035CB62AB